MSNAGVMPMRSPARLAALMTATLLVAVAVTWVADPPPAVAQAEKAASAPPFDLTDARIIGEGARIFRQSCTGYCHGKDGGPSRAPKLRAARLEQSYVLARITKGSPNGMPGFEATLSRENIWKVVAYVMSLVNAEDK
jgi:mono/diheme cytochrome c family protein